MTLKVHVTSAQQCVGVWNNIVILDIAGELDVTAIDLTADTFRALFGRYERVASLSILRAGAGGMSSEARRQTMKVTRELSRKLVHTVLVLEDKGVVAQLARSAFRAFSVVMREHSMSVVQDLDEAIQVLVPIVETDLSASQITRELTQAIARMRADYRLIAGPSR